MDDSSIPEPIDEGQEHWTRTLDRISPRRRRPAGAVGLVDSLSPSKSEKRRRFPPENRSDTDFLSEARELPDVISPLRVPASSQGTSKGLRGAGPEDSPVPPNGFPGDKTAGPEDSPVPPNGFPGDKTC